MFNHTYIYIIYIILYILIIWLLKYNLNIYSLYFYVHPMYSDTYLNVFGLMSGYPLTLEPPLVQYISHTVVVRHNVGLSSSE